MNNQDHDLRSSTLLVAAIVPAHNEAVHIRAVLEVLHQDISLHEIIVIDDGSIDDTSDVVNQIARKDPRVRLIRHKVNEGKGQAMLTGWRATQAPVLLFLDADLIGLDVSHVRSLIQPVLEDRADMSVGLFRGGRLLTDLAHLFTPWLSGQRCLKADLLHSVSREAAAGYGVETAITIAAFNERWRRCNVLLRGVTHPHSEYHRGIRLGIKTRVRMYGEIIRAWWIALRHNPPKVPTSYLSRLMLLIFLILLSMCQAYDLSGKRDDLLRNDSLLVALSGLQQTIMSVPHFVDKSISNRESIQTGYPGEKR